MSRKEDELYKQLLSAGQDDKGPSHALRQRVLEASLESLAKLPAGEQDASDHAQRPARLVPEVPCDSADDVQRRTDQDRGYLSRRHSRRIIMWTHQRPVRYGLVAAAAAVVVLAGVGLWPKPGDRQASQAQWWLGPPAAWADQVVNAVDAVKGVTCRERTMWVHPDGTSHTSTTVIKFYLSQDSYRRDIYDGDFLREIQWYTPKDGGMTQTSVRFDLGSYFVEQHLGSFGSQDPMERTRFLVNMIDRGDQMIGTRQIEVKECVGFEISASKYGDNPDTWLNRIWFDVQTKLPVRIEREQPDPRDPETKRLHVQDQFDFSPTLPADTFTPQIPEGYIHAHPDELRSDSDSSQP